MAFFCFRNEFSQRGKRCNTIGSLSLYDLCSCCPIETSLFPFHFIPSPPPRPESRLRLHVCSCSPTCDDGRSSLILFSRPDRESLGPAPPPQTYAPRKEECRLGYLWNLASPPTNFVVANEKGSPTDPFVFVSRTPPPFLFAEKFDGRGRPNWMLPRCVPSASENFFLLSLNPPSANYAVR